LAVTVFAMAKWSAGCHVAKKIRKRKNS
jgi:hypothetical protein